MPQSKSARRRANRQKKKSSSTVVVNVNEGGNNKRRGKNSRRRSRRRNSSSGAYTYVDTLLNPELCTGVKIPDIVAFPSGTFQVVQDGTLPCGTGGDSVGLLFLPIVGNQSTIYPIQTFKGTSTGSISVGTSVNWPGVNGIVGVYGSFRPVSAMVELEFIGASSADQGMMLGSLYPSANHNVAPVSWDLAMAKPNTEVVPVRNGIKILWKPEDSSDFQFVNEAAVSLGTLPHYYPQLFVAATGLVASSSVIRYHVVCNFEALPNTDSVNLAHTDPSPYDASQLRAAFEWAAQVGNNIFTLYQNAGPYLAAAGGIASRIAATPIGQRAIRNSANYALGYR